MFCADLQAQGMNGLRSQGYSAGPDAGFDAAPMVASVTRQVYRLLVETDGPIKVGTGFLVSGKRVVATNNHVVEKGTSFVLGYLNEKGQIVRTRLRMLAAFPQKDLALLEAYADLPGEPLPLATGYPELASDLYAIGFPAAADFALDLSAQATDRNFFSPSVLKGNVSRIMTGVWLTNQLQHQTPISAGYSGGPLVDNRGVVVGVSTAINKEANGISYGVTAPDLARLLSACALAAHSVHPVRHTAFSRHTPIIMNHSPAEEKPSASDSPLLKRAYQLLERGDVAGARAAFEYLARTRGDRTAYKGLAKTYDPQVLGELKVVGDLGDSTKAQEFYLMANQSAERAVELTAASSSSCDDSLCMMLESADGPPYVICRHSRHAETTR